MFGPQVDGAIQRYRELARDPVAQGLLCLMGSTDRIMHRFTVEKEVAAGFDEAGTELVRVPVTESLFEREAFDPKLEAIRNNTP